MTSRIDPVRRLALTRRAPADVERPEACDEPEAARLPVVVAAQPKPPSEGGRSAAAFAAQLMAQDGQRLGLRAGPAHIDAARGAYNRVEWSGSKDRRTRKGRKARTEA